MSGAWGRMRTGLRDQISGFGLSLADIMPVETPTGHAVIYVDDSAENQIVLFGGSNQSFTKAQIDQTLDSASPGDWALLQNETNLVADIAATARARGLHVCYSAAPFDADAVRDVLEHVTLLALNDGEAAALTDATGQAPAAFGVPNILITRSVDGAELHQEGHVTHQPSFPVTAVDTTGAGDTFLGAFMARFVQGEAKEALRFAAAAAAIQVTRQGAAAAIPDTEEVQAFLAQQ